MNANLWEGKLIDMILDVQASMKTSKSKAYFIHFIIFWGFLV